jgi:hypothetical protein
MTIYTYPCSYLNISEKVLYYSTSCQYYIHKSLNHAVNRIKKAQQYGNCKMPRLWAKAKGINDDIAVKTANFIHPLYH